MISWTDAIIVTVIAVGTAVLVGVLGYILDKKGTEDS